MGGKLASEIFKKNPFDTPEQELFLNLVRTADHLMRGFEELLKPSSLSPTQYNILRILRGGGDAGLACKGVGEHLITRDPDVTRLLDRLENRGFITRQRDARDRRIVFTRITPAGMGLLADLDQPVLELHTRQFAHLPAAGMTQLIGTLEDIRHSPKFAEPDAASIGANGSIANESPVASV